LTLSWSVILATSSRLVIVAMKVSESVWFLGSRGDRSMTMTRLSRQKSLQINAISEKNSPSR
jgi:hypothetical protein